MTTALGEGGAVTAMRPFTEIHKTVCTLALHGQRLSEISYAELFYVAVKKRPRRPHQNRSVRRIFGAYPQICSLKFR